MNPLDGWLAGWLTCWLLGAASSSSRSYDLDDNVQVTRGKYITPSAPFLPVALSLPPARSAENPSSSQQNTATDCDLLRRVGKEPRDPASQPANPLAFRMRIQNKTTTVRTPLPPISSHILFSRFSFLPTFLVTFYPFFIPVPTYPCRSLRVPPPPPSQRMTRHSGKQTTNKTIG